MARWCYADLRDSLVAQHLSLRIPKYWYQIAKDIRPVYTSPTEAAATERFIEFTATSGAPYRRSPDSGNALSEFVQFRASPRGMNCTPKGRAIERILKPWLWAWAQPSRLLTACW